MAITRMATWTLGLAVVLAFAGCSSLGIGDSCAVCEVPAPAPQPQPICAPTPAPCPAPVAQPAAATPRPPAANPGEVWCYVRVPAVTRTVAEQVCVQPASCSQNWIEPVYETVEEQVCVQPAQTRRIPIPAQFETVTEQIMVCPAKTEWRRVDCESRSLAPGEQLGECWTLCEIPPVYETRTQQVCVQPESCREETVPPVYETRAQQVCVREGYYETVEVPPVYETVTREELVTPARWEWRRTTECEVPGNVCPPGTNPNMMGAGMMAPEPTLGDPMDMVPIDEGLPPAGDLPEADPFAPAR
jgi:hypothetical protein